MEMFSSIIPYTSVYIDCDMRDLVSAVGKCVTCSHGNGDRQAVIRELQNMWTSHANPNPVLPCLSVRSVLDLYLKVMNFAPGSEVIVSAINIPTMIHILKEHQLKIVPLDVNIEDAAPKTDLLPDLLTEKTVAILVAHLYGKMFDMEPVVRFASKHKLVVIEDAAEAFCGFTEIGHPQSDITLFSFGVIKYYTSFGGAIVKIRDRDLFDKMKSIHDSYPIQDNKEYLNKVIKYSAIWFAMNSANVNKFGMFALRMAGIDPKATVIKMLRGFPDNMMMKIRHQPCTALLQMMLERQSSFSEAKFCTRRVKGQYVQHRLPDDLEVVGGQAEHNNYWLFPVLVENPDNFVKTLNALGMDAYRGATQLNIVEPENGHMTMHPAATVNQHYPHEAKYLIDHIVYLPVNKNVPFHVLDRIIKVVKVAIGSTKDKTESHRIKLVSKL